jgi:hypothetical protein
MTIFVPNKFGAASEGSLAQYHRIVVTETHGGNTLLILGGVEMYDDFDGASLTNGAIVGGTPSSGTLANLFDSNNGTTCQFPLAQAYFGLNHSQAERLVEFSLKASNGHVLSSFESDHMPKAMELQQSSDGTNWTTIKTWTDIPQWVQAEQRFFAVADQEIGDLAFAGSWRHQRFRAVTTIGGSTLTCASFLIFDNIGDAAMASGADAFSFRSPPLVIFNSQSALFDTNPFTIVTTDTASPMTDPSGAWFGFDFGKTPKLQCPEFQIGAYGASTTGLPTELAFEGSNFGGVYTEVQRYTTTWTTFQETRFLT